MPMESRNWSGEGRAARGQGGRKREPLAVRQGDRDLQIPESGEAAEAAHHRAVPHHVPRSEWRTLVPTMPTRAAPRGSERQPIDQEVLDRLCDGCVILRDGASQGLGRERDAEALIAQRGDNARPRLARRLLDEARQIGDALGGCKAADGAHRLLAIRRVDPGAGGMGHDQPREQDEQGLSEQALGKEAAHSLAHRGREHVAAAPHGLDDLRIGRIALELLAQAAHLRVDAAVESIGGATARQIEQLIAAEDALRPLHQGNQQIVLSGAERQRRSVIADQLARADIEPPAIEMILLRSLAGACRRGGLLAAPQDGPDARDELAAAERLGQVIVGAHLQTDHAIDLVAFGGQHDDRDVRLGAQRAAQRQAVLARQHQVEQDEIDAAVGQHLVHGAAVCRGADPEAFLGQRARDQIADLAMVVDDQDVRRALHDGNIDDADARGSWNVCRSVAGPAA